MSYNLGRCGELHPGRAIHDLDRLHSSSATDVEVQAVPEKLLTTPETLIPNLTSNRELYEDTLRQHRTCQAAWFGLPGLQPSRTVPFGPLLRFPVVADARMAGCACMSDALALFAEGPSPNTHLQIPLFHHESLSSPANSSITL